MRKRLLIVALVFHSAILPEPIHAQDTLTLTYHGNTRDLVSPGHGPVFVVDGVNDPTFRVCVSGTAKHVTQVSLSASIDGQWSTFGDGWGLGVALESFSALINTSNTGAVDFTSNCFYVYGAEGGTIRWPVGSSATVQVTTATGQTITGMLAIPATPTPIPVTPPQLPPQPPLPTPAPGDIDGDGVLDAAPDQCPGTPIGDKVDTSGPWAGCTIDTTPPTVEIRRPLSSSVVRGYSAIMARAKDNIRVAGVLLYLVSWPGITAESKAAYPTGVRIAVEGSGGGPDGTLELPFWFSDGFYTVRADAADWRGNIATGLPLTFQVDNAPVSSGVPTPVPGPPGPAGPAGPIAQGSLVILPTSAPAPAGYVKVADLGALGVLYAKQ